MSETLQSDRPTSHFIQPLSSPSKSMQRSKTVRNLESAGSRVRGLFKKQKDNTTDEPRSASRPAMTTSVSYSSPLTERREIDRPVSSYDMQKMDKGDNRLPTTEAEQLQRQLDQLNQTIAQVRQQVVVEAEKKQQLMAAWDEAQKTYQERESEYSRIEHQFFQLTRAVRATDDDLSTIRDSLKLLKYNVSRLVMSLNKKMDKEMAKQKFLQTWPDLALVDQQGDWIEPGHVNFLAEKLIHHHLVRSVFGCPVYPGLDDINQAYAALCGWFEAHESTFAVRLRQQLALILVKNNNNEGELYQAVQLEKKRIGDMIYNDLADIYSPFIRENDAQASPDKSYLAKVMDILDKAFKVTVAIRGQEVEITTLDMNEGTQQMDEETMVEVRGKTSGTIRFSICPAFIGGDGEHGFLEKGKVVVV